jgi:hypothetical protein
MGDKGKRYKGKRDEQKKGTQALKEKRRHKIRQKEINDQSGYSFLDHKEWNR